MCADDDSILDDDNLYRRVPDVQIVPDDNTGELRPTSKAFQNESGQKAMSVSHALKLEKHGGKPHDLIRNYPHCCLASITAGLTRTHNQIVYYDEIEEDISHTHVEGKKTKGCRRTFSKQAVWIIPPNSA